jgi:hypothetical protein
MNYGVSFLAYLDDLPFYGKEDKAVGIFSRLFGTSSDIERQLEDMYVPMFQETRGMSLSQARSTFRDLLGEAKKAIREEGSPDLPENFGDVLLEKESTDEQTRSFLEKRRKEGVKDQDIIWWWNMHNLERGMIYQVDALDKFAFFLKLREEDGLSRDEAAKRARKFHPIYGDPDDTSITTGEDRPLMPELRDRVNTYVMKKNQADPEKFKKEIEESSTFNALIRQEMKKGNI